MPMRLAAMLCGKVYFSAQRGGKPPHSLVDRACYTRSDSREIVFYTFRFAPCVANSIRRAPHAGTNDTSRPIRHGRQIVKKPERCGPGFFF